MAVVTPAAPAAIEEDKELPISGGEAVAEALTLDDPGAFGVEHNDALVVRDVGWLLCWIDTSQEALDTTLIAYRVAEDRRVFLPCAISADGAFLTHSQALTMVPPKSKVDRFLPRYDRGDLLLHPDNPITVAPQAN